MSAACTTLHPRMMPKCSFPICSSKKGEGQAVLAFRLERSLLQHVFCTMSLCSVLWPVQTMCQEQFFVMHCGLFRPHARSKLQACAPGVSASMPHYLTTCPCDLMAVAPNQSLRIQQSILCTARLVRACC